MATIQSALCVISHGVSIFCTIRLSLAVSNGCMLMSLDVGRPTRKTCKRCNRTLPCLDDFIRNLWLDSNAADVRLVQTGPVLGSLCSSCLKHLMLHNIYVIPLSAWVTRLTFPKYRPIYNPWANYLQIENMG